MTFNSSAGQASDKSVLSSLCVMWWHVKVKNYPHVHKGLGLLLGSMQMYGGHVGHVHELLT